MLNSLPELEPKWLRVEPFESTWSSVITVVTMLRSTAAAPLSAAVIPTAVAFGVKGCGYYLETVYPNQHPPSTT